MVVAMSSDATPKQIEEVVQFIRKHDARPHLSKGEERTIIGVIGFNHRVQADQLLAMPGVENVIPISQPYKLVSREFKPEDTVIRVNGIKIGGSEPVVMAGPCAVESETQIIETARIVKQEGANLLRGGAFKPRTSPYSFQGLGEEGLQFLQKAKNETGLPIVTEILDPHDLPLVEQYADILQIGARNMQNYALLKAVGHSQRPVLLKRGMSAQFTEFLMSAEYIMSEGNSNVILCERGIRSFVEYTRNTLDLNIVPAVKQVSHLPIIVDPSHGTGRKDLVETMSVAAMVAGADGLIIEVHPHPEKSWSDANQTLNPEQFARLMHKIRYYHECGKKYAAAGDAQAAVSQNDEVAVPAQ